MGRQVLLDPLVAVGAIVTRDGHAHPVGDLFIVFAVTGDAVERIDMLEEDRVLRVLELARRMRIARSLQLFTVAGDASRVWYARGGEDILLLLSGVADMALRLDLMGQLRCRLRSEQNMEQRLSDAVW